MRTWTTTLRDVVVLSLSCGVAPLWIAAHVFGLVTGVPVA